MVETLAIAAFFFLLGMWLGYELESRRAARTMRSFIRQLEIMERLDV